MLRRGNMHCVDHRTGATRCVDHIGVLAAQRDRRRAPRRIVNDNVGDVITARETC